MRHSFTSISLFLKCPSRYKAQYVERRVKRTTNAVLQRGIDMHGDLEAAGKAKLETPPHWVQPELWKTFITVPTEFEAQVDTPVLTAKLDVLIASKKEALICDFKSGRSEGDPLQFDVYAAALHEAKGIEEVQGMFIYVDQKKISPVIKPTKTSRESVYDLVHRVETETKYPTRPGFYCTGCPVEDCRYWKASRYA